MALRRLAALGLFTVMALAGLSVPARAVCGLPDPIYSGEPIPAFSPARLKSVYACVKSAYTPAQGTHIYTDTILPMWYAGVETLRTGDGGIPTQIRVRMLNDYGFWLDEGIVNGAIQHGQFWDTSADAVSILSLVTSLAPKRAVAWLNLGDAYVVEANDNSVSASDASTLLNLAQRAYLKYVPLTPSPDAHVEAFLAQHPVLADQTAVAQFVADHANAGNLPSIFIADGTAVDLLGDGTMYYLYATFQGTADEPYIYAYTSPQQNPYDNRVQQNAAYVDFSPLDGDGNYGADFGDDLKLIAFRSKYYILDINYSDANNAADAPDTGDRQNTPYRRLIAQITIIMPNHGAVGKIDSRVIPALSVGLGKPLCNDLLLGAKFLEPNGPDVEGDPYKPLADGRGGFYDLANTTRADIEQNGRMRDIAYFSFDSGAGSGCGQKGILLYDPKTGKAPDTPLNEALQALPPSCDGGEDELISWHGKTYIEADNGSLSPGELVGTGIFTIRDEKILPICLIRNRAIYRAE